MLPKTNLRIFIISYTFLEVHKFFASIGIPQLADKFVEHAIDLDTMLAWKHPQRHLRRIGITQEGVIQRIAWGIRDECEGFHL